MATQVTEVVPSGKNVPDVRSHVTVTGGTPPLALAGANVTTETRKAYIVQYAHDGAVGRMPGPDGEPGPPISLAEPTRQFPVLVGGQPVAPPPR